MLLKVKDVAEVLEIIEQHFWNLPGYAERISLMDSLGRRCAEDIRAPGNIPDFDKSVVDGYAVKARDTFGASDAMPALLEKIGEVAIGSSTDIQIDHDKCAYVPTGGMLPPGSDAVIMIEDTEDLDNKIIAIYKPAGPWDNTIKSGEDIAAGQVVLEKETLIRPPHIGALASIGLNDLKVYRRPRVSIISTGDELVKPGSQLSPGKIWDINSYSLAASVTRDGGIAELKGITGDDRPAIKAKVADALDDSDLVLISGGSSAGFSDYTAGIINELGKPGVLVHGISIKPGKPTIIGSVEGKPVIGMPGQPVSSLVVYRVVVSPLVRRMSRQPDSRQTLLKAVCDESYYSSPGREEYLMVTVYQGCDNRSHARPVPGKSGMITTISSANGMVVIPKNKEGLYKNEEVQVIML